VPGPSRRFLVLHGWQNRRPVGHWQWQLTEALRAGGEQVLFPQFPSPDDPSLADWTELLRAELAQLGSGERIVIAHSLASVLWLSVAGTLTAAERVDRVLLVSPPAPEVLAGHREVAEFAQAPQDPAALARAASSTRLVAGDDDPYCPGGAPAVFAGLELDADVLPGAAHLDLDAGYGRWPAMEAWCRDPAVRLTPRP
jgi:predicted alpha/beta hydrolase family esterase